MVHDEFEHCPSVAVEGFAVSKHAGQFVAQLQIVGGNVQAVEQRDQSIRIERLQSVTFWQHNGLQFFNGFYTESRHLLDIVAQRSIVVQRGHMILLESGVEQLDQQVLSVIVTTVVTDVFPYELLGQSGFVLEKVGRFLQNPLTMTPGMIVAGTFVRTTFAERQLNGPVNGLTTCKFGNLF